MSSSPGAGATHTIVGRVRRVHGVRGEVVVELFTDAPDAIFAPGARVFAGTTQGDLAPDGRTLVVSSARAFKDALLVVFDGIASRDEAERWRDRFLLVPADEVEPPADDEVYLHEFVGLGVEGREGERIGEVIGYYDMPHGILLEIRRGDDTMLFPYREEFVTAVDLEKGVLRIDPPAGLFD